MTNACILIANGDARTSAASFAASLGETGYTCMLAESTQEARDLCCEATPDLVIMRGLAPSGSAGTFAHWLQSEAGIPFILVSTHAERDIVRQASEEGALGYLVEPVDARQVIAVIEAALVRARELHDLSAKKAGLSDALMERRAVSTAVGVIMERHRISEEHAFTSIRDMARSQRRKLVEVAEDILQGARMLNQYGKDGGSMSP